MVSSHTAHLRWKPTIPYALGGALCPLLLCDSACCLSSQKGLEQTENPRKAFLWAVSSRGFLAVRAEGLPSVPLLSVPCALSLCCTVHPPAKSWAHREPPGWTRLSWYVPGPSLALHGPECDCRPLTQEAKGDLLGAVTLTTRSPRSPWRKLGAGDHRPLAAASAPRGCHLVAETGNLGPEPLPERSRKT